MSYLAQSGCFARLAAGKEFNAMSDFGYHEPTVRVTHPGNVTDRACPKCGISVPPELSACPNDGTQMNSVPQEQLRGRYEFIEPIGKGGMSVIYKAKHQLIGNMVAIKLLHDKLAHDKVIFKRFQVEAQAVSRLNHPNLIKVHDFGVLDGGYTFLVMDYVDGRTLADVLQAEGKLAPERAIKIFKAICEGLAHAHSRGILHRDLKPSNVLIVQEGDEERVLIIDFGIAKVMPGEGEDGHKLTSTGEVFGSPHYMSPEQCMGQEVDGRSDIYSMGCLMYETLTGRTPHSGNNVFETIQRQVNDTTEPITKFVGFPQAEQLSILILKALEKQRENRHQNFEELIADLNAVESGRKLQVKRKPLSTRAIGAIAGALFVGVALAIGAGFYVLNSQKSAPNTVATQNNQANSEKSKLTPEQVKQTAYEQARARRDARVLNDLGATGRVRMNYGDLNDGPLYYLVSFVGTKSLDVRGNPELSHNMFMRLAKHPALSELLIDGSGANDDVVSILPTIPHLRFVSLGNTKVTPASFKYFDKIPKLESLYLADLNLTDADIAKLPPMPKLRKLKLDYNPKLTAKTIELCAKKFPNLSYLTFRDTNIGDEAIPDLISLRKLQETRSARTKLTEQGIAKLESARIRVKKSYSAIPGTHTFERDKKDAGDNPTAD
jgi:serine/threonine protein kinase